MGRRTVRESDGGVRSIPRWLLVLGAIGGAVLLYVQNRNGPGNAWQELKEAFGYYQPPHVVGVVPESNGSRRFIISVENRNLQRMLVTGYLASPVLTSANASLGADTITVLEPEEGEPQHCSSDRQETLAKPIVIEPKSPGAIEVEPWNEPCDFSVTITSTLGTSAKSYWTPMMERTLRMLQEYDPGLGKSILDGSDPALLEHLRGRGVISPQMDPANAAKDSGE